MHHFRDEGGEDGIDLSWVVACKVSQLVGSFFVAGSVVEPGAYIEQGDTQHDEQNHRHHVLLDFLLQPCAYLGLSVHFDLVTWGFWMGICVADVVVVVILLAHHVVLASPCFHVVLGFH